MTISIEVDATLKQRPQGQRVSIPSDHPPGEGEGGKMSREKIHKVQPAVIPTGSRNRLGKVVESVVGEGRVYKMDRRYCHKRKPKHCSSER
jgi:hypothetical protein